MIRSYGQAISSLIKLWRGGKRLLSRRPGTCKWCGCISDRLRAYIDDLYHLFAGGLQIPRPKIQDMQQLDMQKGTKYSCRGCQEAPPSAEWGSWKPFMSSDLYRNLGSKAQIHEPFSRTPLIVRDIIILIWDTSISRHLIQNAFYCWLNISYPKHLVRCVRLLMWVA